ncbi:hypothetical protein [Emticicia fontis]
MASFGLVTEGVTDQTIITFILAGWFSKKDLDIRPLQPNLDATDEGSRHGNWHKVIEYIKSIKLTDAFDSVDYIIIQIDTDIFRSESIIEECRNILNNEDTVIEVVAKIKEKLIDFISQSTYRKYKDRIIFAISVDSIECWLLPLYFRTKPAKYRKTTNCIGTLNEILPSQYGFYIDPSNKNRIHYEKVVGEYKKRRVLEANYTLNLSLGAFIQDIEDKNIVIIEEDED